MHLCPRHPPRSLPRHRRLPAGPNRRLPAGPNRRLPAGPNPAKTGRPRPPGPAHRKAPPGHRSGDRRRSRPGRRLRWSVGRGSLARSPRQYHARSCRPHPCPLLRWPMAAAPPNRVADCVGAPRLRWAIQVVQGGRYLPHPADPAAWRRRRPTPQRPTPQRPTPRRPGGRQRLVPVRPRGGPNPGTSDRPGTRSTGSTPLDGRGRVEPVSLQQSNDGGGRDSSPALRDRPRTDRPMPHPRWVTLARSSPR